MHTHPTLRQEFVAATAIVFAGALLVGAVGVMVLLPRFETPGRAFVYVGILLVADVAVFAAFGRYLLQRRILMPLDTLVEGVEAIAAGDYDRRLPRGESEEVSRVNDAVNRMAERLIAHRGQLAANIQSLEETNRQLTEARDELIRVEKIASVGRLAAGIAHEVGNPLSAVIGYIGLLQRDADEPSLELLTSAEREARRIDRIVRGLLDYARPRDTRVERIDVAHSIERVLDLLTTQGKFLDIDVERGVASSLPLVEADPFQLEQVLVNLLLNALDALDETPEPALRITALHRTVSHEPRQVPRRRDDPPDVDYSHRRRFHTLPRIPDPDPFPAGDEVVEIRIADNGPGIPEWLTETVFEPFVTSKEPGKGTGLGLAVAARLIDAMGGTIRIESGVDTGAAFAVVLPVAVAESPQPS